MKSKTNLLVEKEHWEAFCSLVPTAKERNELVTKWIRAYTIAGGESDRLLAQSSLALKLIAHLESSSLLSQELEGLVINREQEELVAEGAIKVGESWIA